MWGGSISAFQIPDVGGWLRVFRANWLIPVWNYHRSYVGFAFSSGPAMVLCSLPASVYGGLQIISLLCHMLFLNPITCHNEAERLEMSHPWAGWFSPVRSGSLLGLCSAGSRAQGQAPWVAVVLQHPRLTAWRFFLSTEFINFWKWPDLKVRHSKHKNKGVEIKTCFA